MQRLESYFKGKPCLYIHTLNSIRYWLSSILKGVEDKLSTLYICEVILMPNRNKLLVPGVQQMLDQYKYEIAAEFGVTLGSDTVARANGSVGGEITKQLVKRAQSQLSGKTEY